MSYNAEDVIRRIADKEQAREACEAWIADIEQRLAKSRSADDIYDYRDLLRRARALRKELG